MVNVFISACIFIKLNWLPPLPGGSNARIDYRHIECVARLNDLFRMYNLIHELVITETVAYALSDVDFCLHGNCCVLLYE